MERNTVKLQGFSIDTFTFDEALEYAANHSGQIVTINPEMFQEAAKNREFADIITNAQMVVPDGIGVEIGLRILGHRVKRIAGVELGRALIDKFAGKPIAFVGAKPEILEKAVANLKKEVPSLTPVYIQDGYFKDTDRVLEELTLAKPKLVLVALGAPKQEFFCNEVKKRLADSVSIGLGGSFDVWSGVVQRAPEVYQKMGLEWLYRTVKEPQRFKRIFPTLPLFILKVVKEKFIGV